MKEHQVNIQKDSLVYIEADTDSNVREMGNRLSKHFKCFVRDENYILLKDVLYKYLY